MDEEQQTFFVEDLPRPMSFRRERRRMLVRFAKKEHGIKTHFAPHMEKEVRWLAVQVPPKRLDDGEPIAGMSVPEMFAWFGRLLDEGGWVGYGPTEYEAVEECCRERKLSFTA